MWERERKEKKLRFQKGKGDLWMKKENDRHDSNTFLLRVHIQREVQENSHPVPAPVHCGSPAALWDV